MIKVELTQQEWILLLNAAALAPFREIAQVFVKVQDQLQKQLPDEQRLAMNGGERPGVHTN